MKGVILTHIFPQKPFWKVENKRKRVFIYHLHYLFTAGYAQFQKNIGVFPSKCDTFYDNFSYENCRERAYLLLENWIFMTFGFFFFFLLCTFIYWSTYMQCHWPKRMQIIKFHCCSLLLLPIHIKYMIPHMYLRKLYTNDF